VCQKVFEECATACLLPLWPDPVQELVSQTVHPTCPWFLRGLSGSAAYLAFVCES
jgi:hypothetical protein